MIPIRFVALPAEQAAALRAGEPDAYGRAPEQYVSPESGAPCRHCLREIEAGESLLTLAYRPFPKIQPFAETGPIFMHAEPCERYPETDRVPEMFLKRAQMLIRGYDRRHRIVYGTGQAVPTEEVVSAASELLARPEIAYVHLRSAQYNCYQCRVERA